jgi:hypothetical protein
METDLFGLQMVLSMQKKKTHRTNMHVPSYKNNYTQIYETIRHEMKVGKRELVFHAILHTLHEVEGMYTLILNILKFVWPWPECNKPERQKRVQS